ENVNSLAIGAGASGAGATATASVTTLSTTTHASVDSGALINSDNIGANAAQQILVQAIDNARVDKKVITGSFSTLAGISGAVGNIVVAKDVTASLAGDVNNAGDITVSAGITDDINLLTADASGSAGVSLSGSVGVVSSTNNVLAEIADSVNVNAGGNLTIAADNATDITQNIGNITIGAGAIGAAVAVTTIDNTTLARIGNGTNIFANARTVVDATSVENITHNVIAGSGGVVGIAGSISVVSIESDTDANIGNSANVNQLAGSGAQDVVVTATDTVKTDTDVGGIAGGLVGVGAGVDITIVKNITTAEIKDNASVSADRDVIVSATADKRINSRAVAGSGGVVSAAGAVALVAIGTALETQSDDPNDDGGGDVNYLSSGDGDSITGAQQQANINPLNDLASSGAGQMASSTHLQNRAQTNQANSGASTMSSHVNNTSTLATDGVYATINEGASVNAGDDIEVDASNHLTVDSFTGAASIGSLSLGGSINVVNVNTETQASAERGVELYADDDIQFNASSERYFSDVEAIGFGAGTAAIGITIANLNDSSSVLASLNNGVQIIGADTIIVDASQYLYARSLATGAAYGGIGISGSIANIDISGSVTAQAGTSDNDGQPGIIIGDAGAVGSLTVTANSDINKADAVSTASSGGLLSGTGGLASLNVSSTVLAEVGRDAVISLNDDLLIDADNDWSTAAIVNAVSGGGLAISGSIVNSNVDVNTTARAGRDASIETAGDVDIISDNDGTATTTARSSSGGLIGSNGVLAINNVSTDTITEIFNGALITSGNKINSIASDASNLTGSIFGASGGIVGSGNHLNYLTLNQNTESSLGNNASLTAGDDVLIKAYATSVMDADISGAGGGVVATSNSIQHALIFADTEVNIGEDASIAAIGDVDLLADSDHEVNSDVNTVGVSGIGSANVDSWAGSVSNVTKSANNWEFNALGITFISIPLASTFSIGSNRSVKTGVNIEKAASIQGQNVDVTARTDYVANSRVAVTGVAAGTLQNLVSAASTYSNTSVKIARDVLIEGFDQVDINAIAARTKALSTITTNTIGVVLGESFAGADASGIARVNMDGDVRTTQLDINADSKNNEDATASITSANFTDILVLALDDLVGSVVAKRNASVDLEWTAWNVLFLAIDGARNTISDAGSLIADIQNNWNIAKDALAVVGITVPSLDLNNLLDFSYKTAIASESGSENILLDSDVSLFPNSARLNVASNGSISSSGVSAFLSGGNIIVQDVTNSGDESGIDLTAKSGSVSGNLEIIRLDRAGSVNIVNSSNNNLLLNDIDLGSTVAKTTSAKVDADKDTLNQSTSTASNTGPLLISVENNGLGSVLLNGDINNLSGDVIINNDFGNILQIGSGVITANLLELNTTSGDIGATVAPVLINTQSGLDVFANGVVNVTETSGNLNLLSATTLDSNAGASSFNTNTGDIIIAGRVLLADDTEFNAAGNITRNTNEIFIIENNLSLVANGTIGSSSTPFLINAEQSTDILRLTADAGVNIWVQSEAVLDAQAVTANGDVTLSADAGISDSNGDAVNISGDVINLISTNGSIDTDTNSQSGLNADANTTIDITETAGVLDAQTVTANGNVTLTAAAGITDSNGVTVNVIGDLINLISANGSINTDINSQGGLNADANTTIDITETTGVLDAQTVTANGDVTLTADAGFTDSNGTTVNVIGDLISLISANGSINTNINSASGVALTAGVELDITETTGDLNITAMTVGSGDVSLTSVDSDLLLNGAIAGNANVRLSAALGNVDVDSVTAVGNVDVITAAGFGSAALALTVNLGGVLTVSAEGDINLVSNIAYDLGSVSSANGDVTLTADGNITDSNGATVNVIGDLINLISANGSIDTDINSQSGLIADANTTIDITETVGALDAQSVIANGDVSLTADGNITDSNGATVNVIGDLI
ncbi:MAG: hypothetical protein JKY66_01645, partial [Spongiibacteraceae bacterium]|nr:hypothetical protein [Spongiibacteraceae bacterium]